MSTKSTDSPRPTRVKSQSSIVIRFHERVVRLEEKVRSCATREEVKDIVWDRIKWIIGLIVGSIGIILAAIKWL